MIIRVRYTAEDGTQAWLEEELRHYSGPIDLEPPSIAGNRAVDGLLIRHSGDRLPTSYGYTITGSQSGQSPEKLTASYFKLKRALKTANQVWRYELYLNCAYGLLGAGTPERGQTVLDSPIAFAVSDLRWRNNRDEVVS
ncbi:hypothetical protein EHF33_20765 (plasmid) [Deinococcus psychrotolerans]|uniref:Uncharacterized protein n=1 Tax=Deinococcus psychrotolerans TaxID=2489213 RepID=A0A3G8YKD0_9DEIO|nr:hypothetical protein [Deinococcus psychrotolerans]AZI45345.1 hypothetical protein EHF33_20765 [Deinococcus psychrotolerans]